MLAAILSVLVLGSVCATDAAQVAQSPDTAPTVTITIDDDGRCAPHDTCPKVIGRAIAPAPGGTQVLEVDTTSGIRLDSLNEARPAAHTDGRSVGATCRLHAALCVWRT